MVPPARNLPSPMRQVASASNRSLCYKVQQQAAPVCITDSGPQGHCSGCTQFVMGRPGRIRLPTDSHIGQSGGEVARLPVPEVDHYCPGVAQHGMVLGPSGNVQPDPIASASIAKPTDSALQSDPSQESDKPKSPRMAPRATAIKEQGFSEAVATRIEAPQRGSTRSVYEAKWAIFTKWCITNQVDFSSDASRVRDKRYLASFSTSLQFGIFGALCLQNGGAPIVSRESFNFIIMKAIFGRFFSEKCYFI